MLTQIHSLNILLPFLYFVTFAVYFLDFTKESKFFNRSKRIALFASISTHLFYLALRTFEFQHPPITSKFEIFSILAFAIGFSFFLLELISEVHKTGVFVIGISVFFQVLSTIFILDNYEVKEVLRNNLLGLHVISALLGYAGFTVSAVYGILFTIMYKQIKRNKFGKIFVQLPSLELLEKLSFYSVIIGFLLLTFAISIGIIWLPQAFSDFTYLDPKLISTTIVWLIFGTGILTKLVGNWYGKKVIKFFLIGYALTILSMFLANVILPSFHSFY